MKIEDVKEGMLLKLNTYNRWRPYEIVKVLGTDIVEIDGSLAELVIYEEFTDFGEKVISSQGLGGFEPYIENERQEIRTNCWGCNRKDLNSRKMSLCDNCRRIKCPKCGNCMCGYNMR